METPTNNTHLPDDLSTEILARLPLRNIFRFKSVSFFRRLFLALHKNSSSSWSLIDGLFEVEDYIWFHGCETWDLPKSPASYISRPSPAFPDLGTGNFAYSSSSNGLVLMERSGYGLYVGNPVLQQWVEIPPCPYESSSFGLVTRVAEDGVVLSFKVLRLENVPCKYFDVCVHSPETGIWTSERVLCPDFTYDSSPMTLNGMHYM